MPLFFDLNWIATTAVPSLPTTRTGAKDDPILGEAIYRGDPYDITFVRPAELQGFTLTAQVRRSRFAAGATVGDPIADFAVDVDGDNVTIALTPEQTASLPDQSYWDLQAWDGDDPVDTWFTGKVKAWGDITRAVVA